MILEDLLLNLMEINFSGALQIKFLIVKLFSLINLHHSQTHIQKLEHAKQNIMKFENYEEG